MSTFSFAEEKALREQRAAAHAVAVRILGKASITAEDRQTYERAMAEVERLGSRIQGSDNNGAKFGQERNWKHELAFGRFLRGGQYVLDQSEKRWFATRESRAELEGAPMTSHVGTYSGLGFFVPTGFRDTLEQATKYFCPISDPAVSGVTLMETSTGAPIPMPTSNDTSVLATIVGEASQVAESDIAAVNQVIIAAYKLTTGLVQCSLELLQDSEYDVEAWLAARFGERLGRGLESFFTTGTGSSQPTGILNAIEACGVSPVIATGSSTNDGSGNTGANSIGSQDLVTLEHSVDPSYRRGAKYMFHDNTLSFIQKLLDKYGRPLWTPGVANNAPDRINGYQYIINQSMPQIAAGANTVVFGDFSKFVIRKVKDLAVRRLEERYAELGLVGFIAFARYDSQLLDAGTHPLNILEQHS